MNHMKYLLPLLLLPVAFAAQGETLKPIELIWYMVGFCVMVSLFILHHLIIEHDMKKRTTRK